MNFHLCRPEVLEDAEVGTPTQHLLQFGGNGNATAYDDHVDVVRGTLQEDVTDIAANDIALHAKVVGHVAYLVEYLLVQNLR